MTNEDEITQLKNRIAELESYLNQFESFRNWRDKRIPPNQALAKKKQKPANNTAKSTRGHRLPEDWQPSPDLLRWAQTEFPHVDLAIETASFIDYWLSCAGSRGLKRCWDRTYRNWIRNSSSRYRRRNETHQRSDKLDFTSAVRHGFD